MLSCDHHIPKYTNRNYWPTLYCQLPSLSRKGWQDQNNSHL